jgi:hypothetical protein
MNITQAHLVQELTEILAETFEEHRGIYLDKGTSLFQTLDEISHLQASQPVGGRCASIAAHVAHVTFYLEVLERDLDGQEPSKVDWGEIWRTVEQVTAEEWQESKAKLQQSYRRVVTKLQNVETWESDPHLEVALAIAVHSAYHLGEIRQARCILG